MTQPRLGSSERSFLSAQRRAALREVAYFFSMIATAAILYGLLFFLPGKMQTRELSAQRDLLAEEVCDLREAMAFAQRDTRALQADPWSVERALRARLGYLRAGERVFRPAR